jgi:CheY-like chemotaxis protein/signal transduction histidine kinase
MGAERILVVDDEARVLDSIHSFLTLEGYDVGKASCGADALALAREKRFDLVLLDVSMPGMDGFEVMDHLFGMDPDLFVIMVTGYATVESAVRALKQGAWDYLNKPFEYADLIKTVKNALNQKRLIRENRKVSARLEASERRYRYMVNNSPDLIYTLDAKGCFSFINNEFEQVLGYSQAELFGRPFKTIVYPDDLKVCECGALAGAQEPEEGGGLQVRLKKAPAKRGGGCLYSDFVSVELKATTMYFPDDDAQSEVFTGTYGVARDVTERNSLHAQLHQAQKMEAIGTLAGGIAHDFNNILMGIQGYTSLVRTTLEPSTPEYRKLGCVDDYVNSGSDMTRQLLGFAQKTDHELCLMNINYILKMSAKMFGRTKKSIVIRQNLQKDLWSCEVDEGQIKQVLLNLYVNAWQAMPGGGHIYIKTENVNVARSKYVELGLPRPGRYVRTSVVDSGVGMDKATIERIFDPFFTTKQLGGGTGLGLATAYGIIKSHGGAFRVLSKKDEGSSFIFYLPAKLSKFSRKKLDREKPEIISGRGTILLVDDEQGVIEVCSEMIESLGYSVKAVTSGLEAVDFMTEKGGEIDLVILDMVMPEMNGFETFERIKSIVPDAKVLISSGYSKKDDLVDILDSNLENFIQKPYGMAMLSEKINTVFDL